MGDRLNTLRLFLREQHDPVPFHEHLARASIKTIPFQLAEARVIDLGCGPGHYTRALRAAGAFVVPVDLDRAEFSLPGGPPGGEIIGNGMALPFASGSVDGVLTSNMIEHTPHPDRVIDEIERVVRPGGWVWISWTNWYSPWGGHDMSPYHYLGPRLGMQVRNALRRPMPKNYPLRSLWPLHIGPTLRALRRRRGLEVISVMPRYYPSQRWIVKVPAAREILTWNCLVIARRRCEAGLNHSTVSRCPWPCASPRWWPGRVSPRSGEG